MDTRSLMSEHQVKFHSFEYDGGKKVTERMKKITSMSDFKSLGDALGISKGTVSTWHQRNLTPFEVVIRLHLHTGASIRYMLFGEGEPFPTKSEANVRDGQGSYQYLDKFRESKKLFDVDTFILKNGHIDRVGTLAIDNDILIENGVTNLMAIKEIGVTYFIDKEVQTATNGLYLINMDGVFSLNTLQRLPGNKLVIDFNGTSIEVNESDIKVAGKVVFELNKK